MSDIKRVLISGGGTGGHIHPALAIADEICRRYPDVKLRFVGALGRMEMEKVPAAGYEIDGLWISGIERKLTSLKNLSFPFKLLSSMLQAGRLLKKYNPDIVIGVGGFASGPILYRASIKNIPTVIQEQNSFPGITNRILASRVDRVCAGFPGLEKWFPAEKITETGNPLRQAVMKLTSSENTITKKEASSHYGFNTDKPIIFIMGGSLGAVSINRAVQGIIAKNATKDTFPFQIIWQCGDRYLSENTSWLDEMVIAHRHLKDYVRCLGFIDRMDLAYTSADIIASRAGAMSISELALVAKPTILIPSPHVAEDHQTKNARSLVDRSAAIMLNDKEVVEQLGNQIRALLQDQEKCIDMSRAMSDASRPEACKEIVDLIEQTLNK